ncbi:PucR family transcriptional regulator [Actinomadura rubrisoli]|uniref:PucR family transcriptional regulator n=2 Tax=Actinomadura rubrisoli TaxID=2530368 RepID=A0A4R5BML6_9ACTN|nr:PucR family transcriptional regulator [Actinomadura rubrisoli]
MSANARRAVEVYTRELPEYRVLAADARTQTELVEFALLLRRRTIELAEEGRPLDNDDLARIASAGHDRALAGVSLASHHHVLGLHSTLAVQELHEAAGPSETDALMRMLGWLGPQGIAAKDAYTRGFVDGQRQMLAPPARVQQLTAALLAGDPAAAELARLLGMPLAAHYLVAVVRIEGRSPEPPPELREKIIGVLADHDRVPMRWCEPLELVLLVPSVSGDSAHVPARARRRALALARTLADAVGRPCAVGASTTSRHALADTLTVARQICRVAPLRATPLDVSTLEDVFVELSTGRLPHVDRWLHRVAQQLSSGPDLVATLDSYYRHDMNRMATAAHLHIHPRTVDYRLRRARELTGIAPTTTRGVRVLSTAVARLLADP